MVALGVFLFVACTAFCVVNIKAGDWAGVAWTASSAVMAAVFTGAEHVISTLGGRK